MTSLPDNNARRIARDGASLRIRGLLRVLDCGDLMSAMGIAELQRIKIDLDGLSNQVEQQLQMLSPHEPQELA